MDVRTGRLGPPGVALSQFSQGLVGSEGGLWRRWPWNPPRAPVGLNRRRPDAPATHCVACPWLMSDTAMLLSLRVFSSVCCRDATQLACSRVLPLRARIGRGVVRHPWGYVRERKKRLPTQSNPTQPNATQPNPIQSNRDTLPLLLLLCLFRNTAFRDQRSVSSPG